MGNQRHIITLSPESLRDLLNRTTDIVFSSDVIKELKFTRQALDKHIMRGHLSGYRFGDTLMFERDEVNRFKNRTIVAGRPKKVTK